MNKGVIISIAMFSVAAVILAGYQYLKKDRSGNVEKAVINAESLAKNTVFFGHQSVGYNIIDGVKVVLAGNGVAWDIKETRTAGDIYGPCFVHSPVGKNRDPYSKIEDFRSIMESGMAAKVDIAFFKFCYVDIMKDTDVDAVLKKYDETMTYLQAKYPRVKFIHFTVPIMSLSGGVKGKMKRLLGKTIVDDDDNLQRSVFNNKLKEKYGAKVFDLAGSEASSPSIHENLVTVNGKVFPAMLPEYTDDGGHLNDLGKEVVAGKLLTFLQL